VMAAGHRPSRCTASGPGTEIVATQKSCPEREGAEEGCLAIQLQNPPALAGDLEGHPSALGSPHRHLMPRTQGGVPCFVGVLSTHVKPHSSHRRAAEAYQGCHIAG
jgi:hypothetical protein